MLVGSNVELIPTRELGRTRRNLLFSTSLLFLLAVANPPMVGIPGFGDQKIHGGLALLAVAAAVVLFAWEYLDEYRLTIIHNNALFADTDNSSMDAAIEAFKATTDAQIETMRSLTATIVKAIAQVLQERRKSPTFARGNAALRLQKELRTLENRRDKPEEGADPTSLEQQLKTILGDADEQIQRLKESLQAEIDGMDAFRELLDDTAQRSRDLEGVLNDLSGRIHRFQRRSLLFKDLLACGSFVGAALCMTIVRLIERAQAGDLGEPDTPLWMAAITGAVLMTTFFVAYRARIRRQREMIESSHVGSFRFKEW